MLKGIGFLLKG
jgi:hypothetical protein